MAFSQPTDDGHGLSKRYFDSAGENITLRFSFTLMDTEYLVYDPTLSARSEE